MSARFLVATLVLVFGAGCAGRSKLEVSEAGGASGAGGLAGTGGTGASAGAPACAADVRSDPTHCGRCFHSCEGGACIGGRCQPVTLVSTLEKAPTALAVDPEYVWFASPVSRVGKELGNRPEVMAQTEGDVWSLAVDDQVYWINVLPGLTHMNHETRELTLLGDPGYRVALDDDALYLTGTSSVLRFGKESQDWQVLAHLPGEALAVDATNVYFTVPNGGGLFQVPKAGGEVVQLTKDTSAFHIAAWEDNVYVSENAEPSGVFEVTGPGSRLLVASLENPYGIAADSSGVFWADWSDGSIWTRSHAIGAVPVKLASGQPFPRNVALDSRAVYWTNDDTTMSVMKVAKP